MINLTRSEAINSGDQPPLTRSQVWDGLVLKGLDGTLFVPGMSSCKVVERREDEIVREIVLRGEAFRERVTLTPERLVRTYRLSGAVMGTLENEIEEDEGGELYLTFNYELEAEGVEPGGAEEQELARELKKDLDAVQGTIDKIRSLVTSGELEAKLAPR